MQDSASPRDRYLTLIDQIVQLTLKGQIRSKEQIYQMLVDSIEGGTGEIFDYALEERMGAATRQRASETDELKQAKAERRLRALQSIRSEWERWQSTHQATTLLTAAVQQVITAEEGDRLQALIAALDPNSSHPLTLSQWQQLAKHLQHHCRNTALETEAREAIQHLVQGILGGLEDWQQLENHLVSWIYDQNQSQLGFGGVPGQRGPWALWAKQVNRPLLQEFLHVLAMEHSLVEWASHQPGLDSEGLVELAIVLRCLQQGLVTWFDKLVYDAKVGAKLSISTFLSFAVIWSQLANGLQHSSLLNTSSRDRLTDACFQITLQILRTFAQQAYFPLYGSIFASFSGQYLRDALNYLDAPLQQAEGTQAKARILTLLGSSQRALGATDRAISFHEQALEIARAASDRPCEIANLNHLSRTYVLQSNYEMAISYSQRALILSRQTGDRQGECNALANLGYSEVFQAQQLESAPEVYETAIAYLQQGVQLSERLGDRQSQALCLSSLGIAHVVLEQPQEAIGFLQPGIQAAQFSGDLYLQGINLSYLAEAHHRLQNSGQAIATGCVGMYVLEQIGSTSWRQPASLMAIVQGQLGAATFQTLLAQQRPQIIAMIGVDGYDYLPQLLERYRQDG